MEGRGVKDSPLWRLCLAGFMLWALAACGELEPMVEPEVSDLQLTVDALKTQVRDTQRNLAELRAEMEARRQELAEAHVARAQLEGRLREAERRLAEARQIVNLQREELMVARAEREKIARGSLQLQSQLRQMQKRGTKGNPVPESAPEEIPTAGAAIKRAQKAAPRLRRAGQWRGGASGAACPSFCRLDHRPRADSSLAGSGHAVRDDRFRGRQTFIIHASRFGGAGRYLVEHCTEVPRRPGAASVLESYDRQPLDRRPGNLGSCRAGVARYWRRTVRE